MITVKAPDINLEEFIEDYLGIQLLPYQKELLRRMWTTDKMYILWRDFDKLNIYSIYEMTKLFIN